MVHDLTSRNIGLRVLTGEGAAIDTTTAAGKLVFGIFVAALAEFERELISERTLVLLFGADIKLAGSLSLAVSLPTMLVGFTRYSRDRSFSVLGHNRAFVALMAAGSILGSFIGGLLLGVVPSAVLLPALAAILLVSAVKIQPP